jgi:hypothetical protein
MSRFGADDGTGPEHWPARTGPAAPARLYASPALARLLRQRADPAVDGTADAELRLVAGSDPESRP